MRIGYARVSTNKQDVAAQVERLRVLGVEHDRVYTDQGLSGRTRKRPGLDAALAACRQGDTLVVTKLDRLARSVRDAADIFQLLDTRGVALSIDGTVYDPRVPTGKLMLSILSMIAEFEADLISARTREGLQVAKEAGRLKGKSPKLDKRTQEIVVANWQTGKYTQRELGEAFGVSPRTIRRVLSRERAQAAGTS